MKILHISYSDGIGGAAIATTRLHKAFLKNGIKSELWCVKKISDQEFVKTINHKFLEKLNSLKNLVNQFILRLFGIRNFKSLSLNIWHSGLAKKINKTSFDIIILHWINAETISCKELIKINKPVIWVFHDLWPISGITHYPFNITSFENKPSFFERKIDKLFYNYKKEIWKNFTPHIVTVSSWLKNVVQEEGFFSNSKINIIHNTLDLNIFKPVDYSDFRKSIDPADNKKIVLFGAPNLSVKRKGGDLLINSLKEIPNSLRNDIIILTFGMGKINIKGFNCINLGETNNTLFLAKLYNISDVMCVPSRQETFGQTAVEAQACGTPVVAFNASGLIDVINHKKTGYLAKPYDVKDYSLGIQMLLKNGRDMYSDKCRSLVLKRFNEDKIVEKFINIINLKLNQMK